MKKNLKQNSVIVLSFFALSVVAACGNETKKDSIDGEVIAEELSEINPVMDLEIISEQPIKLNSLEITGYAMVDKNSGCNYFVHKKIKGPVTMSPIYDETGSVKGCGENK